MAVLDKIGRWATYWSKYITYLCEAETPVVAEATATRVDGRILNPDREDSDKDGV